MVQRRVVPRDGDVIVRLSLDERASQRALGQQSLAGNSLAGEGKSTLGSYPNPDVSLSWRVPGQPKSMLDAAEDARALFVCAHLPGARELVYHAAP